MTYYDRAGQGTRYDGDAMRRTIYLPDELAARVDAYLRDHPGVSLSTLVREALEHRLASPDPAAILTLAGLVSEASTVARQRAEDRFIGRAR